MELCLYVIMRGPALNGRHSMELYTWLGGSAQRPPPMADEWYNKTLEVGVRDRGWQLEELGLQTMDVAGGRTQRSTGGRGPEVGAG